MELISRLSDRANLGCAPLPWHQNIIIHIFHAYYISCVKHAYYATYRSNRSKTVVEKMLYATICHDLPHKGRPAETPNQLP